MVSKQEVMDKLSTVDDPELGMNIVDLGLVYEVIIQSNKIVHIKMTLTTPACPLLGQLLSDIEEKAKGLGFEEVKVDLVWDPPWSPEMMTERAKAMLGIF